MSTLNTILGGSQQLPVSGPGRLWRYLTRAGGHLGIDGCTIELWDWPQNGQRMAADGMTVDGRYAAGLEDALSAEAKLTDEEINTEMSAFQERRQAEAEAERMAQAQSNLETGRAYMEEMSAREEVETTESGLQYIVIEPGEGDSPVAADSVEVHYEGRLVDGSVFDSSFERGQTVTFGLTQVIPGWTEGLQLMKPGAKYKFIIPPELGYGEGGAGQMIGPNATLLFDVELIAVVKADAETE